MDNFSRSSRLPDTELKLIQNIMFAHPAEYQTVRSNYRQKDLTANPVFPCREIGAFSARNWRISMAKTLNAVHRNPLGIPNFGIPVGTSAKN